VPFDYHMWNVPMGEGQERTLEALEVILKAWSRKPFTHHGKHFDFDNVEVWPHPEQMPHPPIWVAASSSPESFTFAGERGYNLLTVSSLKPVEQIGALVRNYHEAWRAAGHDPAGYKYNTHYQIVVDEDRERARQVVREAIPRYTAHLRAATSLFVDPERGPYQIPLGDFSVEKWIDEGRILVGTPDDVVATLQRAEKELGITGVDGAFYFGGMPFEVAERSLRMFAEHVIPRLRTPAAATAG
jgi:alkanesulfonate monooxygenase SsuD/methylene tetrahydromethanopterin reductase-like flavin-dependent oxidoreductase (luciferase family)